MSCSEKDWQPCCAKNANAGLLEEWIQCYLLLTRKDAVIVNDIMKENHLYFGIVKFPLRLLQRDGIEFGEKHADEDEGRTDAPPPLLVQYEEGKFHWIVQKELFAALKQRKVNAYPTIIVLKENAEYMRFKNYYGNVFFYVDKIDLVGGKCLDCL